ncbi:DUF397 domain-containing protein [Streptomyces sp. NPDC088400]|uniref:DUF397 domain-containing protein n=1 Tax=Streptomyces sp. NPDC088400 TaxID=3365861 RepID=UPI0037F28174
MVTAPQPTESLMWFKSSYSGGNTTECLEVARLENGTVIRDSKNPEGPRIFFRNKATWVRFIIALQNQQLS